MIEITQQAAELLKEMRNKLQGITNEGRGDRILRLMRSGGSLGVSFDFPHEGDCVMQSEGTDILLVDPDLAQTLEQATIDLQDTPEGPRLVISTRR